LVVESTVALLLREAAAAEEVVASWACAAAASDGACPAAPATLAPQLVYDSSRIEGCDSANEARSFLPVLIAGVKAPRTAAQNVLLSSALRAEYRFAIFVLKE